MRNGREDVRLFITLAKTVDKFLRFRCFIAVQPPVPCCGRLRYMPIHIGGSAGAVERTVPAGGIQRRLTRKLSLRLAAECLPHGRHNEVRVSEVQFPMSGKLVCIYAGKKRSVIHVKYLLSFRLIPVHFCQLCRLSHTCGDHFPDAEQRNIPILGYPVFNCILNILIFETQKFCSKLPIRDKAFKFFALPSEHLQKASVNIVFHDNSPHAVLYTYVNIISAFIFKSTHVNKITAIKCQPVLCSCSNIRLYSNS